MTLASFSSRFWALILDCIILGLLEHLLPIQNLYYEIMPENYVSDFWESLAHAELLILSPLYFVGFRYWNHGQTPGKKLCGIRTVSIHRKKMTIYHSALDCLGYYILPLDLFIGVFVSHREQRMTQVFSDTVVIEDNGDY